MGLTLSEKIISAHAGKTVRAGDIAIVDVDGVMATDAGGPLAVRAFQAMGGTRPWRPDRVSLVLDHAAPAPTETISNLHKMLRDFARETGCHFYDIGMGICHQLMVENEHVKPGDLFLGADSHTPTYGALGAFAVGVGSTDMAAVMFTGKTWLKVPKTVKIVLHGRLRPGTVAKDLVLYLVGLIGGDGANYQTVEFTGEAVRPMTLASRMVLANMGAEMGAKAALVDMTDLELPYPFEPQFSDPDAEYSRTVEVDVSHLRPMISRPHSPSDAVSIDEVAGQRVDYAFLGSCTNARLEDLHAAAAVLRGKRIAPTVRLLIAPASKRIFNAAMRDGTLETLSEAGAAFLTSGCGPCVGSHLGVPGNGEVVISSTNRNFKGRMGNPNALIYLGSPAVVAASALTGVITDPATVVDGEAE